MVSRNEPDGPDLPAIDLLELGAHRLVVRRDRDAALEGGQRLGRLAGEQVDSAEVEEELGTVEVAARRRLARLNRFGSRAPALRQGETVVREVAHLWTGDAVLALDEDRGL